MNHDHIDQAIMRAAVPALVKKVQWKMSHDLDGDPIIKVDFHIPKSDNATRQEIAQIIGAQKAIETRLASLEVDWLAYFNVLADQPNMRKAATAKRKIPSSSKASARVAS